MRNVGIVHAGDLIRLEFVNGHYTEEFANATYVYPVSNNVTRAWVNNVLKIDLPVLTQDNAGELMTHRAYGYNYIIRPPIVEFEESMRIQQETSNNRYNQPVVLSEAHGVTFFQSTSFIEDTSPSFLDKLKKYMGFK